MSSSRASRTRNLHQQFALTRAQTCPTPSRRCRPRQWQGVRPGVVETGTRDGSYLDTTGFYYRGGKLVLHETAKKQRDQQEMFAKKTVDAFEVNCNHFTTRTHFCILNLKCERRLARVMTASSIISSGIWCISSCRLSTLGFWVLWYVQTMGNRIFASWRKSCQQPNIEGWTTTKPTFWPGNVVTIFILMFFPGVRGQFVLLGCIAWLFCFVLLLFVCLFFPSSWRILPFLRFSILLCREELQLVIEELKMPGMSTANSSEFSFAISKLTYCLREMLFSYLVCCLLFDALLYCLAFTV